MSLPYSGGSQRAASQAIMFSRWLGVMGSMRKNSVCGSPGRRIMIGFAAGIHPIGSDWLARKLPEVLAIVEYFRCLHVIRAVLQRLNFSKVLGVANVLLEIRRHRIERPKQRGEDAAVGREDRIGGIRHVESDCPVVGV